MNRSSVDIPVHDIGPILEIHDHSIYWFMGLIVLILVVFRVLVKQIRRRVKPKEVDERRHRYVKFSHINVDDPKKGAYEMSEQGYFFAHDNEQTLRTYHTLFERLTPYKYAKKVEAIDEETLEIYRNYREMIDG
ncbi:MAG: hypothetical protein Q8K81_00745 [Sulfuricurvum sp.]|nr:hypothetical protein [Sulfuricurvum sp.]